MSQLQQKRWLTDLLEGVPSIVFILLWRQSGDLETAGWTGSGVALVVFTLLFWMRSRMHPVLLGVNIHILLATPLIVGLFRIGQADVAEFLVHQAYPGVLVTVLAAGMVQSVFARNGFSGLAGVSALEQRLYSMAMLAVCGLGAVWAFAAPGSRFVPVVATLTVLIVGRNFVQARLSDRNGTGAVVLAGGAHEIASSELAA